MGTFGPFLEGKKAENWKSDFGNEYALKSKRWIKQTWFKVKFYINVGGRKFYMGIHASRYDIENLVFSPSPTSLGDRCAVWNVVVCSQVMLWNYSYIKGRRKKNTCIFKGQAGQKGVPSLTVSLCKTVDSFFPLEYGSLIVNMDFT